jgi:hypothetical protein
MPMTNSLKQITKKAILPAIRITGVCEADGDEVLLNTGDCLNEYLEQQCHVSRNLEMRRLLREMQM